MKKNPAFSQKKFAKSVDKTLKKNPGFLQKNFAKKL